MKKILLSSVALLGLTAGAHGGRPAVARLLRPRCSLAVPIFTWTGFYVGVNAGYGWQDNNDELGLRAGRHLRQASPARGVIGYGDDDGDGFVGGGQIGYNYQIGPLRARRRGRHAVGRSRRQQRHGFVPAGFGGDFVPAGTAGGIDWFGTVRGRARLRRSTAPCSTPPAVSPIGGGDGDDELQRLRQRRRRRAPAGRSVAASSTPSPTT